MFYRLICEGLVVHDFGTLFLVLKILWLRICSLLYRYIVIYMNAKY